MHLKVAENIAARTSINIECAGAKGPKGTGKNRVRECVWILRSPNTFRSNLERRESKLAFKLHPDPLDSYKRLVIVDR